MTTVTIAADKTKEQETVSHARQEVSTRHEQVQIAHEKVNKCYKYLTHRYIIKPHFSSNVLHSFVLYLYGEKITN